MVGSLRPGRGLRRPPRSTWDEAVDHGVESFADYSPALAAVWPSRAVDGEVDRRRARGRQEGRGLLHGHDRRARAGSCSTSARTFDSVSTLAHELGHAYHNRTLAERNAAAAADPDGPGRDGLDILRDAPDPGGAGGTPTPAERLAVLEYDLQGACQVVVDIHSRFLFESEVFDRRRQRTMAVSELCADRCSTPSASPTATGSITPTSTPTCGR